MKRNLSLIIVLLLTSISDAIWISPISHTGTFDGYWRNEIYAYDNDINTFAVIVQPAYTTPLVLNFSSQIIIVQIYAEDYDGVDTYDAAVNIEYQLDGNWYSLYSGSVKIWNQIPSYYPVSSFRISSTNQDRYLRIYEFRGQIPEPATIILLAFGISLLRRTRP